MGPRFCKRGNLLALLARNKIDRWLQWGHAFVSVETVKLAQRGLRRNVLQWGHAFVSVETLKFANPVRKPSRFNGATLL